MKVLFALMLIAFSVTVSAESPACEALIEAFGIDPVPPADGALRKFVLKGKTEKDETCVMKFMPEFCSFELGSPLETPLMYYLQDTDYSTIKIQHRAGEKFFFKSTTKESEDSTDLIKRKYIKVFNVKRDGKGLEAEFRMSISRLTKKELAGFTCSLTGPFIRE